jgi:hypothetical protein
MNPTKPVHKVRLGTIESAVWENKLSEGKPYYKVTFCRNYKDGDEWKTTESFGRDDLLVLAKVADQTHSWIFEHPPGK